MKKHLFIFFIFLSTVVLGQTSDSSKTKRIGIIGGCDFTYNFQDKVLNEYVGRKWTVGVSLTNKSRKFIGFFAVGIKGFKFNLYSPSFRESFTNDLKDNYVPINGTSEDSLIGAKMNISNGARLYGTYSQYIQVGFILNKKFRPSFSFYFGNEEILLRDDSFAKYEDPEHGDIDYVGMSAKFYEFKIGCTPPFKIFSTKPFSPSIFIGYKYVDYGLMKFNSTPLSSYTNGNLKDKYSPTGKITLSMSFFIWSNWE